MNDVAIAAQGPDEAGHSEIDRAMHLLRPSEYTAALIQALHQMQSHVRGASVLELGTGSGVVLAALGKLGAARLCGVDVEEDALVSSRKLMGMVGLSERCEFCSGDMWAPVEGRRFDLVVANLPHFPTERGDFPGRLVSWSDGGPDGRRLLDPFLRGLGAHLRPGGRAVITHNAFVDIDRTHEMLAAQGLVARILNTVMLPLPQEKLCRMTHSVRVAEEDRSVHQLGPYVFIEMHLIEIAAAASLSDIAA